jgi:hypothetical protein
MKRGYRTTPEFAEWDAEIEADFHRTVAAAKRHGRQKKLQPKYIGCPLGFFTDVCRRTKGRTALVVALCLYRQTIVEGSATVSLGDEWFAELKIDRKGKSEALHALEAAGIVRLHQSGPGKKSGVELIWRPS